MSTEIAPLQAVQNKIRDKIRAEFVELMPEDMWTKMVQSVIEEFTNRKKDQYNSRETKPSPLEEMISTEIRKLAQEKVNEQLSKLDANAWTSYGVQTANDAVIELVTKHFTEIVAAMQQNFGQLLVQNALAALRQQAGRGY